MSTTEAPVRTTRRVHWLELFFDLVMVAFIGQVAHTMHGDPSLMDGVAFVGFLAAAWWVWANATITLNLFGARITPWIWIGVTVVMIAVGVMAAAIPEALGERADAFALANAVIRLVWVAPWLLNRRTSGQPWWRSTIYTGVPVLLWSLSTLVEPPWQVAMWVAAVAIEIGLLSSLRGQQTWLNETLDVNHLAERVGLFVVIVFGESILTIIAELDAHWMSPSGVTAVLGFAAVSMLAWIYFGYAAGAVERGLRGLQGRGSVDGLRDSVMYLPFLLVAGVTLFASALGTAVAETGHHLPLGAAVALAAGICLFFVASAAEALRYGAPWRGIAVWALPGALLPWALVPLSGAVTAEVVVAASIVVIAVELALVAATVRRARAKFGVSAAGSTDARRRADR